MYMKKSIIAASVICLMLTGCGKKSDIETDLKDIQGTDVIDAGMEEVSSKEASEGSAEYKVNFTEKSNVDGYEMTADLVIDTRIPSHVTIKKVKKVNVDDDYLLSLSKKLFDGGKYDILKVKGYSQEESDSIMLEIMDSLNAKSEEFSGVFEPSPYYKCLSDEQLAAGLESQADGDFTEGKVILSGSYEIEKDGQLYACNQENAFIKGDIDGEAYILEYLKQDFEPNNEIFMDVEDIMIYPMDGRQLFLELNEEAADADLHKDNLVSYDDALIMAEKYIQKIGLNDYSVSTVFDFFNDSKSKGVRGLDGNMISGSLSSDLSDSVMKGYRFIFTPEIDDMNISYCAGTERTTMEYDFDQVLNNAWIQPAVQVDVDATGIRDICINCVYEPEETLTDDSNIISFEKANEIAKQMYSEKYVESFEVGDIRLEYIIIQYDKETVMAPAWVYYRLNESGLKFAVNALDGSVVHFGYNAASHIRWLR